MFTKIPTQIISCSASFLFLLSTFPAFAQNSTNDVTRKCLSAINKTKIRLQQVKKLEVVFIEIRTLADEYSDYPEESPFEVIIAMEGASKMNVLHSPQLMFSLTKDFISQCPDVSLVRFGLYQSDIFVRLGRIGNNIVAFECKDPDGEKFPWGYTFCG